MKWAIATVLALAVGACTTVEAARSRLVRTPPRCADRTVSIYFEPNSAELTQEGRLLIANAARAAQACRVASVDVLGLSDAAGAPEANLDLSKARAQAVAGALAADGLPPARFDVGAAGAAGAVAPGGEDRPLRRRVDVTLRLSPQG